MSSLTLIAAMARNRVIGRDNALPWKLPEDLRRFRTLTIGKPVLMGRRTYQSIGRPLPGRDNLVLSRDPGFRPAGCRVYASVDECLDATSAGEIMVIGGAEVYAQTLARASRMHLTLVDAEIAGDACFPDFDPCDWAVSSRECHAAGPGRALGFEFVDYSRES